MLIRLTSHLLFREGKGRLVPAIDVIANPIDVNPIVLWWARPGKAGPLTSRLIRLTSNPIVWRVGKCGQATIDVMMTHVVYCLERYIRALTVTLFIPSCRAEQSRAEQSRDDWSQATIEVGKPQATQVRQKEKGFERNQTTTRS